jgi:hypothetical protein
MLASHSRSTYCNGTRQSDASRRARSYTKGQCNGGLQSPLQRAVVISEAEYNNDYTQQANEVVFVLPDANRAGGPPLLDKPRLLMRRAPNGI